MRWSGSVPWSGSVRRCGGAARFGSVEQRGSGGVGTGAGLGWLAGFGAVGAGGVRCLGWRWGPWGCEVSRESGLPGCRGCVIAGFRGSGVVGPPRAPKTVRARHAASRVRPGDRAVRGIAAPPTSASCRTTDVHVTGELAMPRESRLPAQPSAAVQPPLTHPGSCPCPRNLRFPHNPEPPYYRPSRTRRLARAQGFDASRTAANRRTPHPHPPKSSAARRLTRAQSLASWLAQNPWPRIRRPAAS